MIRRSSLGWVYTEPFSKNRPGGAAALKISRKEVVIHAAPDEGEHCPVSSLNTYMERVPSSAIAADNCLYLRPVPHSNGDLSKPWFSTQPVGKHTLSAMVKKACVEVGITGKTDHSLRATGATLCSTLEYQKR